jgi:hypothetical protein
MARRNDIAENLSAMRQGPYLQIQQEEPITKTISCIKLNAFEAVSLIEVLAAFVSTKVAQG